METKAKSTAERMREYRARKRNAVTVLVAADRALPALRVTKVPHRILCGDTYCQLPEWGSNCSRSWPSSIDGERGLVGGWWTRVEFVKS
jgi:hypothetical protein